MNVNLRLTRQELTERWHVKNEAVAALTGQRPIRQHRYMEREIERSVYWDADRRGYVPRPLVAGLRYLGKVEAETRRRRNSIFSERLTCGWYTNPDGMSDNSGDGLVWGVVYLLPGRKGRSYLVAGTMMGGCDDGPVIDFSKLFETEPYCHSVKGSQAAEDAAIHADGLAEAIAEDECQYQWEQREREEENEAEVG